VRLTITVLAVGLTAVSSGVRADATVTEFPTPSAASLPQGIDIAPNGDVWFSETSAGKVAVLRTNHTTSEFPLPNGGQPTIVKVAADGIWFTDGPDRAIGHLNPATGQIEEFAIRPAERPYSCKLAQTEASGSPKSLASASCYRTVS
jgi:virginiamycin B lyase